jgi:hypothetical protein
MAKSVALTKLKIGDIPTLYVSLISSSSFRKKLLGKERVIYSLPLAPRSYQLRFLRHSLSLYLAVGSPYRP